MAKIHVSPTYPCDLEHARKMAMDLIKAMDNKTEFLREDLVRLEDLSILLQDEIKAKVTYAKRQHGKKQFQNASTD